jgi:hypothetical protein
MNMPWREKFRSGRGGIGRRRMRRIYRDARALIADPEHWTRGAMARDAKEGPWNTVRPLAPEAVSWCAYGALQKAQDGYHLSVMEELTSYMSRTLGASGVIHWNDTSTHEEVLAGFDRVIESLA